MNRLGKILIVIGLGLLGFTFGCYYSVSVSVATEIIDTKSASDVDCLLIKYSNDNSQNGLKISSYWLNEKGCKRCIVYPDSYVPVLIRQEDVDKVRALVGKDCFLRISPDLE